MVRILSLILICLSAPLWADCTGNDRRTELTAAERSAITADLAETPFAEGNHWIARRGAQRIDVIGTFHLNLPGIDTAADRLRDLVHAADLILFEISAADQKAFAASLVDDMSPVLIVNGPTLPDLMTEDGWARLSDLARARGIPAWTLAKMRPWMLAATLAVPPCMLKTRNAELGLDLRLGAFATEAGVPQGSLETVADVIAIFETESLEDQVRAVEANLSMMFGQNADFYTLSLGYFEERNAETLMALKTLALREANAAPEALEEEIRNFEEIIIERRNRAWMPEILGRPEARIVVAVGAAHLPGDTGILRLLEQAGFTLTRAPF